MKCSHYFRFSRALLKITKCDLSMFNVNLLAQYLANLKTPLDWYIP